MTQPVLATAASAALSGSGRSVEQKAARSGWLGVACSERTLTNEESIEAGIGPVCAQRF